MTKLSRWFGVLEVTHGPFEDDSPLFYPEDDPFVVRFKIRPLIWLSKEKAVPIHEDELWNQLSFTKNQERGSSTWTGKIRSSLVQLNEEDGLTIERVLRRQLDGGPVYEVDEQQYQKFVRQRVRTPDKTVAVSVPVDREEPEASTPALAVEVRESVKVQALIARVGASMGVRVWLPRADRGAVLQEWQAEDGILLGMLPLNYDEATLKTIEQIDVIWLKRRSIVRAFEVEHTTSVYSGILRMADLLALQPNMDIRLHIVAPAARRDKVFQELTRPVFSLLEGSPLADRCTYISYDSLREIASQQFLEYLSADVLDTYAEEAE